MNLNKRFKLLLASIFVLIAVITGYFIEKHSNTGFFIETATDEEMDLYNASDGRIIDGKININSAPAELIDNLDNIGEKTARSIVEYRETHGNFKSIDELSYVKGIGQKTIDSIRDKICAE